MFSDRKIQFSRPASCRQRDVASACLRGTEKYMQRWTMASSSLSRFSHIIIKLKRFFIFVCHAEHETKLLSVCAGIVVETHASLQHLVAMNFPGFSGGKDEASFSIYLFALLTQRRQKPLFV